MPFSFAINGQGGQLMLGSRTVSTFEAWSAKALTREESSKPAMRLTVSKHKQNPAWWPRVSPQSQLYVRLKIGTRENEKRATLLTTTPLTLQVWENEADAPN